MEQWTYCEASHSYLHVSGNATIWQKHGMWQGFIRLPKKGTYQSVKSHGGKPDFYTNRVGPHGKLKDIVAVINNRLAKDAAKELVT